MNVKASEKQRWAVIDSTAIGVEKKYEPHLIIARGGDSHVVGTQTITMGRTSIPPTGHTPRHCHACAATSYTVQDPLTL